MSSAKKGRKIRSRSGTTFQSDPPEKRLGATGFAKAISEALRREFDGNASAVKTIVALTRANERAVKNWYEGRNGPSGEFLIQLCRHSDAVLETVLLLANRHYLVTEKKFIDTRTKLSEMISQLDKLLKQPK
ncbi:hypothetical protein [Mesorhizobium sp. 1B3]|uniref:hypothetical protein n=1 Tax=Mesorhizobium sp. 1B3 TaxID=3243599 RepID=UPI003D969A07